MKKFLTVLLALSVVFTYTVGSAFAAVPSAEAKSTFDKAVDAAVAHISGTFDVNYTAALDKLTDDEPVTADHFKAAAEVYKTAQKTALAERAAEMKAKYAEDDSLSASEINEMFKEAKTDGDHKFESDAINEYATIDSVLAGIQNDADTKEKAAALAFNEIKDEYLGKLNVLDLSVFSTNEQKIVVFEEETLTSYHALAEKLVAWVKGSVANTVVESTDTYDGIKSKAATLKNSRNHYITGTAYTGYTFTDAARNEAATHVGAKLLTIDEEDKGATTLEAKKALKLAEVQAKAANVLKDTLDREDYQKVVVPTVDAYVLAQKYLIEVAKSATELDNLVGTPSRHNVLGSEILANVNSITELEAFAAKYKLLKDDSGNLLKDAEAIDNVVAAAKLKAYKMPATKYDTTADKNTIKSGCNAEAALTTFAVEAKKAEIEKAREAELYAEDGSDLYYAPEKEKVNALFDGLIAKVDAAKSDKEVNKIKASDINSQLALIKDKGDVKAAIQDITAFTNDMTKLNKYKSYLNANAKPYSKEYKDFSEYNDAFFADFYAEKGVRVAADITANIYAQAQAVLDAVKSNGTIDAEKAAVEAKIKALPKLADITVADKAAILDAWTAAKDYKETTKREDIANEATLTAAVEQLLAAEKYELLKLYKEIPAKVTVADKAAVNAYKAAIEAVLENAGVDKMYAADAVDNEIAQCKAALKTIRDLEKKAVQDAINALPLNITLADKAAVEAARNAYEDFVKEYTVYETDNVFAEQYNAAKEVNTDELRLAEATISALRIEAVKAVKVVKNHSKAGKGYIKIAWSTIGDTSAIDGYRVYRSTKANSGYKYIFQTKNKSYKNTKSLKKGTRYYYKVRAYVELDGKRYFSDYSNKAYRAAK